MLVKATKAQKRESGDIIQREAQTPENNNENTDSLLNYVGYMETRVFLQ